MLSLSKTAVRWVQISARQLAKIKRPPVVTIMGHVDHGKTTLLDNLRNSKIVEQEFGGITQHIGAFVVPFKNGKEKDLVTFLDTPGHAAFASMRQRGANITDIVVLVVACEDGVLDQTVESIKYAKNSNVPMIVAVNKIDKYPDPRAIDKEIEILKKQLLAHDIITEQDGGDVQLVKISALKGVGLEDLKEAILALAETLDLKAEVDCPVKGHVIESQVHQYRGKMTTILVTSGTLRKGDILMAGSYNYAKVRALIDERNQLNNSCLPGYPIQVTGWREERLPSAGELIAQVSNEAEARSIINEFRQDSTLTKAIQDAKAAAKKAQEHQIMYKEMLKKKFEGPYKYRRTLYVHGSGPQKEKVDEASLMKVNIILKCDVDGSLEAILDILDTYDKDGKQQIKLDVMHHGVGAINENDYTLAASFPNSVIYGFNVRPSDQKLLTKAKHEGVNIKLYNVIYHLIDDLKSRIIDLTPEAEQEIDVAKADVIQEFVVKEGKTKTHVAGCRCSWGTLKRDLFYRLVRNNEVLHKDLSIKTLKHLKEEAKEIERDRECGISFEGEPIQFLPGDTLIAYEKKKFKPRLKWDLKGFN